MKISTRKREIGNIAILFALDGFYLFWWFSSFDLFLFQPIGRTGRTLLPFEVGVCFSMIVIALGYISAASLLSFQKWGRILAIITSIIFFFLFLGAVIIGCASWSTSWPIVVNLICSLLCIYSIFILFHKDAKLILKRKGNLAGLVD